MANRNQFLSPLQSPLQTPYSLWSPIASRETFDLTDESKKKQRLLNKYPWISMEQAQKIEKDTKDLPVGDRSQAQQKIYSLVYDRIEHQNNQDNRIEMRNNVYQQALSSKSLEEQNMLTAQVRAMDLATSIRSNYNVQGESDDDIYKNIVSALDGMWKNWRKMFADYLNGSDKMLHILWLKDKPILPQRGAAIAKGFLDWLDHVATNIWGMIEAINPRWGTAEEYKAESRALKMKTEPEVLSELSGLTEHRVWEFGGKIAWTAALTAPIWGLAKEWVWAIPWIAKAWLGGRAAQRAVQWAVDTAWYKWLEEWELATGKEMAVGAWINVALWLAGEALKGLNTRMKQRKLDDKTKLELSKTTPQELEKYIEITTEAQWDISKPTAFESAARKTDDAIDILSKRRRDLGSEIGEIREGISKDKASTKEVYSRFRDALKRYWDVDIERTVKQTKKGAKEILDLKKLSWSTPLTNDEVNILKDFVKQIDDVSADPTIQGFVNLKLNLNNQFKALQSKSSQFWNIKKAFTDAIDHQILKVAPEKYKWLLSDFGDLVNLMDDIDNIYWVSWEKWSTMIRNMFWSNAWKTRELLHEIKKVTGVDLYKEGQLARFVMESMGETRGLEQMLGNIAEKNKSFFTKPISTTVELVSDLVSDPIRWARDYIAPVVEKPAKDIAKRVTSVLPVATKKDNKKAK